jgi:hypothetical protein
MNQLQEPHTDERGSRGDEGLMDSGGTVCSQADFAKALQPRRRALDHPAKDPDPATMFGTAVCDSGTDATPSQFPSMGFRIVGTIAVQNVGLFPGKPNFPAHVGDGVHDVKQFLDVMNVRPGDRHSQGHALSVRDHAAHVGDGVHDVKQFLDVVNVKPG